MDFSSSCEISTVLDKLAYALLEELVAQIPDMESSLETAEGDVDTAVRFSCLGSAPF